MRLERVGASLPDGFDALRGEAFRAGHGMLDRLARNWGADADRYARPGEALVAARVDGLVVGIAGLTHDPVLPDALLMRRFYVSARFRRRGVARFLAEALLALRREGRPVITVNAGTPGAPAFWMALGFAPAAGGSHMHILRS